MWHLFHKLLVLFLQNDNTNSNVVFHFLSMHNICKLILHPKMQVYAMAYGTCKNKIMQVLLKNYYSENHMCKIHRFSKHIHMRKK